MTIKGLVTDSQKHQVSLLPWQRSAIDLFDHKLKDTDRPFPCIPATQGHSLGQFCYGFVSDPRSSESTKDLAGLLRDYSAKYRDLGKYTSLIVFFETPEELKTQYTVEEFEELFWKQLNGLGELDECEWPENIPIDPHDPVWEFCFNQEKLFMYCGTPAHTNRLSRNFPYFVLAITPRWVLEEFNANPHLAGKIKTKIRERIEKYDSIPVHPDLNSYGKEDNYEWKQYFLHDDDTSLSKCPFHRFLGKFGFKKKDRF
ncbi:YqcI/YcgG family protein [Bacillus luteolus]|uniref:YqcI/YcgG family protein n=1 Tax=Litchfieldia luteola TaxID=682179 RepID=A0ABR9QMN5_9BACI|nr:YqcI/YcgG family protein [Cytobacillus luteolus]MBE4909756.1 YqcI/YcgG family protein [Cytobacillus luteolus]